MNKPSIAVLLLSATVLASCGGSGSGVATSEIEFDTPATSAEQAAAEVAADGSVANADDAIRFHLTSETGWEYDVDLPFTERPIKSAVKDISEPVKW